jgi:hypothetical protein
MGILSLKIVAIGMFGNRPNFDVAPRLLSGPSGEAN